MSRELVETLREYADKAEASNKLHWADAMRQAAQYIKDDLDMPEPAGAVRAINPVARTAEFTFNTDLNGNIPEWLKRGAKIYKEPQSIEPLIDEGKIPTSEIKLPYWESSDDERVVNSTCRYCGGTGECPDCSIDIEELPESIELHCPTCRDSGECKHCQSHVT